MRFWVCVHLESRSLLDRPSPAAFSSVRGKVDFDSSVLPRVLTMVHAKGFIIFWRVVGGGSETRNREIERYNKSARPLLFFAADVRLSLFLPKWMGIRPESKGNSAQTEHARQLSDAMLVSREANHNTVRPVPELAARRSDRFHIVPSLCGFNAAA